LKAEGLTHPDTRLIGHEPHQPDHGSGANLNWLVKDKDIAPHMGPSVGRILRSTRTVTFGCLLKAQCCPKTVRKIPRSIYEEARDVAGALAKTEAFKKSSRERKRVEMLFAHLKRILLLGRLRFARAVRCPVRVHLAALRRTFAGLPSWSPGHHRSSLCCKRQ
jgi:hypothetical protein